MEIPYLRAFCIGQLFLGSTAITNNPQISVAYHNKYLFPTYTKRTLGCQYLGIDASVVVCLNYRCFASVSFRVPELKEKF